MYSKIETNRKNDSITGKAHEEYIMKYLFKKMQKANPHLKAEIITEKVNQIRGTDLWLYFDNALNGRDWHVDIKSFGWAYLTDGRAWKLPTFCQEISFINRAGKVQDGWFTENSGESDTTHWAYLYSMLYPTKKSGSLITESNMTSDDIKLVKAYIVSKKHFQEYLTDIGMDMDKLRDIADKFRKEYEQGKISGTGIIRKEVDGMPFTLSTHLGEKPINIVIQRSDIEVLSSRIYNITQEDFETLKSGFNREAVNQLVSKKAA